jgi:hypothetical protein
VKEALSKILRCGLTCPFTVFQLSEDSKMKGCLFTGGFVNFPQYQFISLATEKMAFAIVFPRRTEAQFYRKSIMEFLKPST